MLLTQGRIYLVLVWHELFTCCHLVFLGISRATNHRPWCNFLPTSNLQTVPAVPPHSSSYLHTPVYLLRYVWVSMICASFRATCRFSFLKQKLNHLFYPTPTKVFIHFIINWILIFVCPRVSALVQSSGTGSSAVTFTRGPKKCQSWQRCSYISLYYLLM